MFINFQAVLDLRKLGENSGFTVSITAGFPTVFGLDIIAIRLAREEQKKTCALDVTQKYH